MALDGFGSFEREYPATPASLGAIRRGFSDWLSGFVTDRALHRDLVLCASELSATAMRVVGDARISVHAWVEGDAVIVEVRDAEGEVLQSAVRGLDGVDASRGLSIVASLADVLTVRSAGGHMLLQARKERVAVGGDGAVG